MRPALFVAASVSLVAAGCTATTNSSTPAPVQGTAATVAPSVSAPPAGGPMTGAEQVYKKIQMFKGMPAARLLAIMNRGFSNSLGVSCSHCHVVGEYDREDKPTKQIARDMSAMVTTIN